MNSNLTDSIGDASVIWARFETSFSQLGHQVQEEALYHYSYEDDD